MSETDTAGDPPAADTSETDTAGDLATVELRVSPTGVATVELSRPQALNAWNQQLGRDLLAALRRVGETPGARAVVITGAGRAFSSGADLKDFSGGELTPDGRP